MSQIIYTPPKFVTTINTDYQGGIMLPSSNIDPSSQTNAIIVGSNNAVNAVQVVIPFIIDLGHISYSITTAGSAGAKIDIGLYNAYGTALLVHTGAQDATGTGVSKISVSTYSINPGIYFYAFTSNDNSVQMAVANIGRSADILNAGTTKLCGSSSNSSSSGVLPSSLGTITGSQLNAAMAYFSA